MSWYDGNTSEKQIADKWLVENPGEVTSIVATFDIA